MTDRSGKFAGDDPFEIARTWLAEAEVLSQCRLTAREERAPKSAQQKLLEQVLGKGKGKGKGKSNSNPLEYY